MILASCPAELRGWEWYYCQRKSRGGMITIPGQSGVVRTLEFSPDGKLIAFCGELWVKIWDGQQVKKLGDHKGVVGLSFTGEGKRVVSLGADNTVKEWEVASGTLVRSFELPFSNLTSNGISRDGRWVAAGNRSGTIKVWDANDRKERKSRQLRQSIRNLAFSADGTKIIAAVRDGVYLVDWQNNAGRLIRELGSPPSMAISADLASLASVAGNSVLIWDLSTSANTQVLNGQEGNVQSVAYSHDGKRLATGGRGRTVRVWDATTGRLEGSYQGHASDFTCVRFSPDDHFVAASSKDSNVYVWRVREDMAETIIFEQGVGRAPSFSDDAAKIYLLTGDGGHWLSTRDSRTMLLLRKFGLPNESIVGCSKDFSRVALKNHDTGGFEIRDAIQGTLRRTLSVDQSWSGGLSFIHTRITPIDDERFFVEFKIISGLDDVADHISMGVWDDDQVRWLWSMSGNRPLSTRTRFHFPNQGG